MMLKRVTEAAAVLSRISQENVSNTLHINPAAAGIHKINADPELGVGKAPKVWSTAARNALKREQERRYSALGQMYGLGSDPEAAYRFLGHPKIPMERLDLKGFEESYRDTLSSEEMNQARGYFSDWLEKYYKASLPTPYEDPSLYPMLLEMADTLEASVNARSPLLQSYPLIGTVPSGLINAKAVILPKTNDYLILFEQGLFRFVGHMAKLVSEALPPLARAGTSWKFTQPINPYSILENNTRIANRFAEVLYAYVVLGDPMQVEEYSLATGNKATYGMLLRCSEFFILGHEYSHIILKHLTRAKRMPTDFGGELAEEIQRNWQDEYDADQVGVSIMGSVMRDTHVDLDLSYWGAEFFFVAMEILDKCISLLATGAEAGDEVSPSHPPFAERRSNLRKVIRDAVSDTGEVDRAVTLAQNVGMILTLLWEKTKAKVALDYTRGIRPSPLWHRAVGLPR
jgi:hypothetical protein